MAASVPPIKVLDLGCGQGASSWFLAREGFKVTAFDGSVSAIFKAKNYLDKEGLEADYATGCMTKLPFPAFSFDAVVDVVSSVHNPLADLKRIWQEEVHKVLKPQGKVFSVIPTKECGRRAFEGFGTTTYLSSQDVYGLLAVCYRNVEILRSTYDISKDSRVDTWIVTAERSA